eukprot:TRINITY_DN37786_c0_g1_i1.p1 TRINITY_DN37786_c0_g1~~TRINITY_DN37786_c0_g1_i1.p1  ORF type:complete len:268 (-),score=30.86 TRINITY_DN37786_c0_g1_i1:129-887(-)
MGAQEIATRATSSQFWKQVGVVILTCLYPAAKFPRLRLRILSGGVLASLLMLISRHLKRKRAMRAEFEEMSGDIVEFNEVLVENRIASHEAEVTERLVGVKGLIRDTLQGLGRIERIRIWACPPKPSTFELQDDEARGLVRIRALVQLGHHMCGHPEYIHGGFSSALLDELFGWTAWREKEQQGLGKDFTIFTANLNVDYRRPVPINSLCFVDCWVVKVVRRKKVYIEGGIYDRSGIALVESKCLYIIKGRA